MEKRQRLRDPFIGPGTLLEAVLVMINAHRGVKFRVCIQSWGCVEASTPRFSFNFPLHFVSLKKKKNPMLKISVPSSLEGNDSAQLVSDDWCFLLLFQPPRHSGSVGRDDLARADDLARGKWTSPAREDGRSGPWNGV